MSVVEKIHLETIEDLHEFLSPIGKYQQFFNESEQYLFRGEGSLQYPLNPSLFRDDTIDTLYRSLRKPLVAKEYYQYEETYQWIEIQSLVKFFKLANNAGIPVPDSEILKRNVLHLHDTYVPQGDIWLPEELLDLFSLARHHSLPTRMIDWSDNIYIALYFACANAMKKLDDPKDDGFGIYVLHFSEILETDFPIRFARPLHAFNENAHAQGGVLSYMETKNLLKEKAISETLSPIEEMSLAPVDLTPLNERLKNHFKDKAAPKGLLHQITFSRSIIPELYLYLDSLHYSAENIYPDLYGVVRKMLEDEANWTRNQENKK